MYIASRECHAPLHHRSRCVPLTKIPLPPFLPPCLPASLPPCLLASRPPGLPASLPPCLPTFHVLTIFFQPHIRIHTINACIMHIHIQHVVALVRQVLAEASLQPEDVDVICYTKGPGMGGPLRSCAVCARTLAQVKNPLARSIAIIDRSLVHYIHAVSVFFCFFPIGGGRGPSVCGHRLELPGM